MTMPLHPNWQDIALRLVLTMVAGAVIGFDRGVKGQAAGLRTTILVGLAAAVAMIQANVLLSVGGKTAESYGVMDLMRMPLGILTGVGFIGGGTILKRGDLVSGVTTAATLWVTTVIGLCFGGGQLDLGIAATILVVITLWALQWLDIRIPRERRAMLVISAEVGASSTSELDNLILPPGYNAQFRRQSRSDDAQHVRLWYEITWTRPEVAGAPWDLLKLVNEHYPVVSFEVTSGFRHG
jgi:putative Mg2+ transporter-C (MgtC) family protein